MTFEAIAFDDYKADMDELGDRAAEVTTSMRAKIDGLERQIMERDRFVGALIVAAGGSITMPTEYLAAEFAMEVWDNPADQTREYRAKITKRP